MKIALAWLLSALMFGTGWNVWRERGAVRNQQRGAVTSSNGLAPAPADIGMMEGTDGEPPKRP